MFDIPIECFFEFDHANSSWVRLGELNRGQGSLDIQIKNRNRWITYRYFAGTETLRRLAFNWRSDKISSGRFIASLRGVSKKVRKKPPGQKRFRNIYSGGVPERTTLPTYLQQGFPRNFPNIVTRPLKRILSDHRFNKITMPNKETLSIKIISNEKIAGKKRRIKKAYKDEFNNAIVGVAQVGKNVTINIPIRKLKKFVGKR